MRAVLPEPGDGNRRRAGRTTYILQAQRLCQQIGGIIAFSRTHQEDGGRCHIVFYQHETLLEASQVASLFHRGLQAFIRRATGQAQQGTMDEGKREHRAQVLQSSAYHRRGAAVFTAISIVCQDL